MEDSVSTIVYIIITFIILIVSIIKKRNKKKLIPKTVSSESFESIPEEQAEAKAPKGGIEGFLNTLLEEQSPFSEESNSPSQSTEDFFEDFEDEQEEEKKIEAEGVTAFAQDDPNTARIETGLMDSLAIPIIDPVNAFDEEIESGSELGTLIEDFDIKKAIIYSEILNPKYF